MFHKTKAAVAAGVVGALTAVPATAATVTVAAGGDTFAFDTATTLANVAAAGAAVIGIALLAKGIRWIISMFI